MTGKKIVVSFSSVINNFAFGSLQVNGNVDTSAMSIKALLAAKGTRKVTMFLRGMGVTSVNQDEPSETEKALANEKCTNVLNQLKAYDEGQGAGKMTCYEHTPSVSEIYGKRYAVTYIDVNGKKTPLVFEKLSHISFNEELSAEDFKGEFSINGYELTDTNPLTATNE